MNAHTTNPQIIHDPNGNPAFVVLPYVQWLQSQDKEKELVPNEVVSLVFDKNLTPMQAWREYLGLTQAEVANRVGIAQATYAQMEKAGKPRRTTIKKIAVAMGCSPEQLDF